mgnify:CR=1 FL=1
MIDGLLCKFYIRNMLSELSDPNLSKNKYIFILPEEEYENNFEKYYKN